MVYRFMHSVLFIAKCVIQVLTGHESAVHLINYTEDRCCVWVGLVCQIWVTVLSLRWCYCVFSFVLTRVLCLTCSPFLLSLPLSLTSLYIFSLSSWSPIFFPRFSLFWLVFTSQHLSALLFFLAFDVKPGIEAFVMNLLSVFVHSKEGLLVNRHQVSQRVAALLQCIIKHAPVWPSSQWTVFHATSELSTHQPAWYSAMNKAMCSNIFYIFCFTGAAKQWWNRLKGLGQQHQNSHKHNNNSGQAVQF